MNKMRAAGQMVGIALVCLGYAAFFAYDYWWTKRKLAESERARMILESDSTASPAHRARLLAEEGVPNA